MCIYIVYIYIYMEYHNLGRKPKGMQFSSCECGHAHCMLDGDWIPSKVNFIACVSPLRIGTYIIKSIAIIILLVHITLYY